jgi:hypothetical protein
MRLAIIISTAALIAIGLVATGTAVYVSKASRISKRPSRRAPAGLRLADLLGRR